MGVSRASMKIPLAYTCLHLGNTGLKSSATETRIVGGVSDERRTDNLTLWMI